MKVLIFCDYAGNLGDAIRIDKIHRYLKSKGCIATICNLRGYYRPASKILKHPGIASRVIVNAISSKELAMDVAYENLGVKVLSSVMKKIKPDVILAEGTLPGNVAVRASRDFSIKTVVDLHGLASYEYEENVHRKTDRKRLMNLREAEKNVYENSWKLLAVSANMARHLEKVHRVKKGKILIVRNGSDVQNKVASYKKPLNVIYGGIFAFWENINAYLDMAEMDTTKSRFNMIGDGPLKQSVLERVKTRGIGMNYMGYIPRKRSLEIFSAMNVGVAPTTNNVTRYVASPIKVFDYMACGLPVITQHYGEWGHIVRKEKCGIATKNTNGKEFAEALKQMMDRNVWVEMSENAIRVIKKKYNWNDVLKPLERIIA